MPYSLRNCHFSPCFRQVPGVFTLLVFAKDVMGLATVSKTVPSTSVRPKLPIFFPSSFFILLSFPKYHLFNFSILLLFLRLEKKFFLNFKKFCINIRILSKDTKHKLLSKKIGYVKNAQKKNQKKKCSNRALLIGSILTYICFIMTIIYDASVKLESDKTF